MPFAGRSTAVAAMAEAQRLEIIHPDILVKEAMAEAAAWDAEEEARVAALQPPAGEETLEAEDASGANHVGAPTEDAPVEDAPVEDAPVEDATVEDAPEGEPAEDAPEGEPAEESRGGPGADVQRAELLPRRSLQKVRVELGRLEDDASVPVAGKTWWPSRLATRRWARWAATGSAPGSRRCRGPACGSSSRARQSFAR
jgi:hypothetical protein